MFIHGLVTWGSFALESTPDKNFMTYSLQSVAQNESVLKVSVNTPEGQIRTIIIPVSQLLFNISPRYNQNGEVISLTMAQKPELIKLYQELGYGNNADKVFIYPIFTQAAYDQNGFYDYYETKCDSKCLTVPIPYKIRGTYSSSITGAFALTTLGYSQLNDIDVDKNPDILKQYKRVIVLHNEYVTKKEFDAITSHPDVIYFYPNSLYAEVKTDYDTNTITLVRGHGYPEPSIVSGFNWNPKNSKFEFDPECNNWSFYTGQKNATLLNCYPEYRLLYDSELLRYLQTPDPTDIPTDISRWVRYGDQLRAHILLVDFDIEGDYIPKWVSNPAQWTISGDISRVEFAHLLTYLSENKIIK